MTADEIRRAFEECDRAAIELADVIDGQGNASAADCIGLIQRIAIARDAVQPLIAIAEDQESLALAATSFIETHFLPYGPATEFVLRAGINQTVANLRRVPDALMADLLRRVNRNLNQKGEERS